MSASISFWEREQLLRADHIVIGAGIIGLSAAISLKEARPNADVLVLEREILPSGASSKNAGFACFCSLTEFLHDLDELGPEKTIEIVGQRKAGFDLLRKRLGDERLGYNPSGGYELIWSKDASSLDRMADANKLLFPIFGSDYFILGDKKIEEFGFNRDQVKHLVSTPFEGTINTGLMIKNLSQFAAALGVRVITGAQVEKLNSTASGVVISVMRSVLKEKIDFAAKSVIVATNALAPTLLPGYQLKPGRGQILITHPIPGLKIRGAFFFDQGFYYFRNVENRVLFGGGRNTDVEGETTTSFEISESIQSKLDFYLKTIILPSTKYTIDMRWSGIMGFSKSYQPIVEKTAAGVVVAFGCNGMGVALGTSVGAKAASLSLN